MWNNVIWRAVIWNAVIAALTLAVPALAQCPDQVIVRQPTDVRIGKEMKCGGVEMDIRRLKLSTNDCPSYVLIVPTHDTTEHRDGSGTYTSPAGKVDVTLLEFTCGRDWFLVLPLGSSCKLVGERVVVQLTTYAQFRCDREPAKPAES